MAQTTGQQLVCTFPTKNSGNSPLPVHTSHLAAIHISLHSEQLHHYLSHQSKRADLVWVTSPSLLSEGATQASSLIIKRRRQESAAERLINAAEKWDRKCFQRYLPQWGWKGIDFSVGDVTVLWQDGATSAEQAFHYNSPGLSMNCEECLLRRHGIFSSLDQKRFHVLSNFWLFFWPLARFQVERSMVEKVTPKIDR